MKPRTLLLKEPLACGCLRYTFRTSDPVEPNTESEIIQCHTHMTLETVPPSDAVTAVDPIQFLMNGPAPREREIERDRRAIKLSEDNRGCPNYKSNSGTIAAISLLLAVIMIAFLLRQITMFTVPNNHSPYSGYSDYGSSWDNKPPSGPSQIFIRATDPDSNY